MKKYFYYYLRPCAVLFFVNAFGCATSASERRFEKAGVNKIMPLILPFAPHSLKHGYDHSVNKGFRAFSDCQPECPKIDVWQYQFKPHGELLVSREPISTLKSYWKIPSEARVISISLFGQDPQYVNGIIDFIDSFRHLKKANNISDEMWGYETFTVRVYTPKRNPSMNLFPMEFENAVPEESIQKLLDRGAEIAFVDNHLEEVAKDATFWRFLILDEKMPEGHTLRFLSRDADWKFTAGEAYAVGEWIMSGHSFHRMQLGPACMSPLMAHIFSGIYTGEGLVPKIKEMMEYFPYRFAYGDDELFLRDLVWPKMKFKGSVLTHIGARGFISWLAEPYTSSCEEPTQSFCDKIRPNGLCEDIRLPDNIVFPFYQIEQDATLEDLKKNPENFNLHLETERGLKVKAALSALPVFYKAKDNTVSVSTCVVWGNMS